MTQQMAPRRRNPKGGRHVNAGRAGVLYCRGYAFGGRVAGARWRAEDKILAMVRIGRRRKVSDATLAFIFQ